MERIYNNSSKFLELIDRLNPNNSGILFSILLHLTILLFAVGLPNIFGNKDVNLPNIIPIEILNISETTNIEESKNNNEVNKNKKAKQKKFNSSENTEILKKVDLKQKDKVEILQSQDTVKIKEKSNLKLEEKEIVKIKEKDKSELKNKVETIKTDKIKPKIKPEPKKFNTQSNSDVQIQSKNSKKTSIPKKDILTSPKQKPEQDFDQMLASMQRDLRNDQSNNLTEDQIQEDEDNKQSNLDENNENSFLSISEIDLLIQQLSSCWIAPAGAVIPDNTIIKISASLSRNMEVFSETIRIADTNLSKSNPFYGPITDSAKRTLLNPECTPLKLPKEKYETWKNLTIKFDHDIMKGN